jgi:hypothetical protein
VTRVTGDRHGGAGRQPSAKGKIMSTAPTVINMADDLPQDTAELHIVKPGTNIPTGWIITLAGPGHPQSIEIMNEGRAQALASFAQIEQAQINNRRKWKSSKTIRAPTQPAAK